MTGGVVFRWFIMTGGVTIIGFSIFTSTSVHNGNIILECDVSQVLHKKILLQQFAEEIYSLGSLN